MGLIRSPCKLSDSTGLKFLLVHLARFQRGCEPFKAGQRPIWMGIIYHREHFEKTRVFRAIPSISRPASTLRTRKATMFLRTEWTIFENTHEAIIDQQTFDLVQKIRSNVRRYPNGWGEAAPLTGLLYCADCGGKMYVHRTNNGKRISQYTCCQLYQSSVSGHYALHNTVSMTSAVLTLVSDTLRAIAEYSRNDRTEFIRHRSGNAGCSTECRYIEKAQASGCCSKESRRTGKTDLQNL